MTNPEQILAAGGSELSRLAGHVLNGTSEHCVAEKRRFDYACKQCNRVLYSKSALESCWCIADPIDLTWDNAMKHFGEIEHNETSSLSRRDKAIIKWFILDCESSGISIKKASPKKLLAAAQNFLLGELDPKHFLKIAAIEKLNAGKGKK